MGEEHDKFLCRIAKTLYGNRSSHDSISLPLTELATELYNEVKRENSLDRLNIREIAEINQNAYVSTCSLVLAIMYLEKLKTTNLEYVEKISPSELFLVSLLVASKYLNDTGEDDSLSNYEWAECAGIPLKKLNEMEKDFLNAIQWNIHISEQIFWSRLRHVERILAKKEGEQRGWYSYTEVNTLLTASELHAFKELLKQLILCVTCYTASLASFIATGLLVLKAKHIFLNCVLCSFVNQNTTTISNECLSSMVFDKVACDINHTQFPYAYFIKQVTSLHLKCSYERNLSSNGSVHPNHVDLSYEIYPRKTQSFPFKWIIPSSRNNKPSIAGKNS